MRDEFVVNLQAGVETEAWPGVILKSDVKCKLNVSLDHDRQAPRAIEVNSVVPADDQLVLIWTSLKGWRVGYLYGGQWHDNLGNYIEGVERWAPLPD